jgi:HlyD family secretion protein
MELSVDIARPDLLEKKKKRRLLWAGVGATAVVLLTLGVSRLKPAAPTVERATVVLDVVKRGEMVRDVRGLGTLVPEDIGSPRSPRRASSGACCCRGRRSSPTP